MILQGDIVVETQNHFIKKQPIFLLDFVKLQLDFVKIWQDHVKLFA